MQVKIHCSQIWDEKILTLGSTPVQSTHKKFPGRLDIWPLGQKGCFCGVFFPVNDKQLRT